MKFYSREPVYHLNVVLRETGLQADLLRAWERRYDLPKPQRSPGGHRLYSEHDVATIRWLKARQAQGVSISRAVELWKEMLHAGRDPLAEEIVEKPTAPQPPAAGSSPLAVLRESWLNACLAFNVLQAEDVMNQAFALYPLEMVCFEVLQKGLAEIGSLWYENRATAQQEHFATASAARRVEALIGAAPVPTREQTILTGCPAGELHSFPVLLLSLLLRRVGFNVVYLGADIPLAQMEQTAEAIRPALTILAAQTLPPAPALRSAAGLFKKAGLPLAYGGLVFNRIPGLRRPIPGFFLGESLESLVAEVERLLTFAAPFKDEASADESGPAAAQLFKARLPFIKLRLAELQEHAGFNHPYIASVNSYFAEGLLAALELGDPAYLETDLAWLKNLLAGRQIPKERLNPYLACYSAAITSQMGVEGGIITDWITSYIDRNATGHD